MYHRSPSAPDISEISASARRRRPSGHQTFDQGVDPVEAGSRGGGALGVAARPATAGATISRPNRASVWPQAGRRPTPCSPMPPACSASAGTGASCMTICTAAVQGLSPAAGPTRCATRRSARRRSTAARGGAPARSTEAGCRRPPTRVGRDARRTGQAAPFAKPLTRTQGRDPDRRGRVPGGAPVWWATASAGSRAGRSTGTVQCRRPCIRSAVRPLKTAGRSAGNCSTLAAPAGTNRGTALVGSYGNLAGTRHRRPSPLDERTGKTRARRSVTPRWTNGEPALGRVG